MSNIKSTILGILGVILCFLFFVIITAPTYGGEVLEKRMIFGKEYRIETVEGEPANYWVYWGDEKYKWEPQPWQQEDLAAKGPLYYNTWIQPGLPLPWAVPLEEREKLPAITIRNNYIKTQQLASCLDWHGEFCSSLISPTGEIRPKKGIGANKNYIRHQDELPPELKGVYYYKSLTIVTSPQDVRGLAFLSITQQVEDLNQNNWMYLPSMRKVRRLPMGVQKDNFVGLTARNEQFSQPIFNHQGKLIKTEIFKKPDAKIWGFNNSADAEEMIHIKRGSKKLDGIGEPCVVIEVTPGHQYEKLDWWFKHKTQYIGLKSFMSLLEYNYDEKGRLIQTIEQCTQASSKEHPAYMTWGPSFSKDYKTEWKSCGYLGPWANCIGEFDQNLSDSVWTERTLLREITDCKRLRGIK